MCADGHLLVEESPIQVGPFSLNNRDIAIARAACKSSHLTLTDFFHHLIPRICNSAHQFRELHMWPSARCPHTGCLLSSEIKTIHTSWPQILHIIPETVGDTVAKSTSLPYEPVKPQLVFKIPCNNSMDSVFVQYNLVGRIVFKNGDHFISEIWHKDRLFQYDDTRNNGKLQDYGPANLFDVIHPNVRLLVYHRTSVEQVTFSKF